MEVIDRPMWGSCYGRAIKRAIEIAENSGATVPLEKRECPGWLHGETITTSTWARFLKSQVLGGQIFVEPRVRPVP